MFTINEEEELKKMGKKVVKPDSSHSKKSNQSKKIWKQEAIPVKSVDEYKNDIRKLYDNHSGYANVAQSVKVSRQGRPVESRKSNKSDGRILDNKLNQDIKMNM